MNLLQMEHDVLPMKVMKQDKADYIQSLIDTREMDDINVFLDCMAQIHIAHLQHDIATFEQSMQERVDKKGGQETSEAILKLISENPKITTMQMASHIGINRSAISKHIKRMQEEGKIIRIGSTKGGYWELLQ